MANRYGGGGGYRAGNTNGGGYGNFGRPAGPGGPGGQGGQGGQGGALGLPGAPAGGVPANMPIPPRQRLAPQDDYDPYGDGYSSSNGGGGGSNSGYMSSSSRNTERDQRENRRPPPGAGGPRVVGGPGPGPGPGPGLGPNNGGRQMYRQDDDTNEPYDKFDERGLPPRRGPPGAGRYQAPPPQQQQSQQQQPQTLDGRDMVVRGDTRRGADASSLSDGREGRSGYGHGNDNGHGSSSVSVSPSGERRIGQDALDRIRKEWPSMCDTDCVPVQMALQLLDGSSVGRAHEYREFQRTHAYLQTSLKNIVHDYHQGFNSSIGTFHKIQSSIQASQKKVRLLKDGLAASKASLCKTDAELPKLYAASQQYDELLATLADVDELRQVPERLEARISEKRFLTAVDVLQGALRTLRKPELDGIGALSELRSYLASQEKVLMDSLVSELHQHLYLKSPYCQERWQTLSKQQHQHQNHNVSTDTPAHIVPFFVLLDDMELEHAATEDPARNPEGDTFYYITLVVEALNKLGRLEAAVEQLKNRMPVELFLVVSETVHEMDQKHPSSLRGGAGDSSGKSSAALAGVHLYGRRETQMRADVIYDLLWTLYGKFEAIAEGHRILHEYVKALIRREGAGNNSALLGGFKELWNLYQNEIRSLLHNYVTNDADLYRGEGGTGRSAGGSSGRAGGRGREHLFKLHEADGKSDALADEYEALDAIIRAAVPGLTSDGKGRKDKVRGVHEVHTVHVSGPSTPGDMHKPLVEPSVFNMSLLLPPTLVFLTRLRGIVPPGSDLAASALTSFLDNFLVNVFQPQLDETLGKLADGVFGEADAFQADPAWSQVARRPVFKGTTAFFSVVTAFCRMLGTIPHDQALSALMISQMMRYYDRCFSWFKALVTKAGDSDGDSASTSDKELRLSAVLALEGGDIANTARALWAVDEELADDAEAVISSTATATTTASSDAVQLVANRASLLAKEVDLLLARTSGGTDGQAPAQRLALGDVISDRDAITQLCLLYTSMKWLAHKIGGLRHITQQGGEAGTLGKTLAVGPPNAKPEKRRWTLPSEAGAMGERQAVYLPMTQESVESFDSIVSSYEELAATALLTLHLEVRCRVAFALGTTLSPAASAPYLLDQDVNAPDPPVLALNAALAAYDATVARCLVRAREVGFVRQGLAQFVNAYLVRNASMVTPMNARGCARMQLNILVLQQNLKNVEDGVDLARAAHYYRLFEQGPDAIVGKAKAQASVDADAVDTNAESTFTYTYDELKALLELSYSEPLANPERGIENAARRQMGEKLMELGEHLWQM